MQDKFAEIVKRFLAGDVSLARDTLLVNQALQTLPPTHPARSFQSEEQLPSVCNRELALELSSVRSLLEASQEEAAARKEEAAKLYDQLEDTQYELDEQVFAREKTRFKRQRPPPHVYKRSNGVAPPYCPSLSEDEEERRYGKARRISDNMRRKVYARSAPFRD